MTLFGSPYGKRYESSSDNRCVKHEEKQAMAPAAQQWHRPDRRHFIGGSDAMIIMGDDEPTLIRLWREKRGEIEPQDLSDNLIVQLGVVGESPLAPPSWRRAYRPFYPAFRFLDLPLLSPGPSSRISNIAVVRRRMASARDGWSGCLRRQWSNPVRPAAIKMLSSTREELEARRQLRDLIRQSRDLVRKID